MALISTEDAKAYLRVDSSDEDTTVGILLASAIRLCIDIARLTDDQWEVVDSDAASSDEYTEAELSAIRETMKVAILYPPYGYDWDGEQMIINPEQAAVVKEIFAALLSGKGTHAIADDLNRCGIPTKRNGRWTATTIRGMLSNEKYVGDCLFQKTYSDSRFVRHNNHGVVNADTLSPDGIQARLEELQKELIKKANNKQDYDAIADEIFRLRDQKEQSELDSHHREEVMNRIKELQNFIAGQETDITEFDEALVKKLIEKITVFADHFTVEFKSGINVDIEC